MPKERAYRFIVTSGDQDSTTRDFQRTVRSHAASVSHPDRIIRRQTRTLNDGKGIIVFEANPLNSTKEPSSGRVSRTTDHDAIPKNNRLSKRLQSSQHRYLGALMSSNPHRLSIDYLSGETFSPLQHLTTYHAPYLPGVINHYIHNLTIPIPELDGSSVVPVFRGVWLPIVLHDPVIFQVIILFAATHYATFADPSQYKHLYLELLTLKQSALLALIHKVHSEQTTTTTFDACQSHDSRDTIIAAAAKMASYEAIFGTREAFHTHMTTVTRLLRQQGGPATLGIGGFLARLLIFIDTNSAFLLGTKPYLVEFGLSHPADQPRSAPPRWLLEVPPHVHGKIRSTSDVNLEYFLGLMNVNTPTDESPAQSRELIHIVKPTSATFGHA